MPKAHKFTDKNYKEVLELQAQINDVKLYKKLLCLQLRIEGKSNAEIAEITKYSKSRVSALVCIYANEGIEYFKFEHRVGGNRRNISFDEERRMLVGFEEAAKSGNVITAKEIKSKYDGIIGHESGKGTVYRLLKRHKWRQVMPRSKHPKKASEEVIEASKKLSLVSKN